MGIQLLGITVTRLSIMIYISPHLSSWIYRTYWYVYRPFCAIELMLFLLLSMMESRKSHCVIFLVFLVLLHLACQWVTSGL